MVPVSGLPPTMTNTAIATGTTTPMLATTISGTSGRSGLGVTISESAIANIVNGRKQTRGNDANTATGGTSTWIGTITASVR